MSEDLSKQERALTELGKRFRAGFAKRHPVSQRSLDTARKVVREQWAKKARDKGEAKEEPPAQTPDNEPKGPELEL
jgi:hypothetical protein